MKNYKKILVYGFAIFGCVFGAGNLILPPMLGKLAGGDWWLVALGFLLTGVVFPYLALTAFSKIEGTVLDFGKIVSKKFGVVFGLLIYIIALSLPIPRTAAVTHEIAIEPFFGTSSLLTSTIYFGLILVLAINREKAMSLIGSFLTPIILVFVLMLIILGASSSEELLNVAQIDNTFSSGIIEGYQTYDVIAGIVTGAVMTLSIKSTLKGKNSKSYKIVFTQSSLLACALLLMAYVGLIFLGAKYGGSIPASIGRTEYLKYLSETILGQKGGVILAILIAMACFTTAASVVVGVSDFIKQLFNQSESAYVVTAIVSCLLGILIGQLRVEQIIQIALPILLLVYPITIVLTVLNNISKNQLSKRIVRSTLLVTVIFTLPSSLESLGVNRPQELLSQIPGGNNSLFWVLPVIIIYSASILIQKRLLSMTWVRKENNVK